MYTYMHIYLYIYIYMVPPPHGTYLFTACIAEVLVWWGGGEIKQININGAPEGAL